MLCRDKLACPGYRVLGLASKARIPHGLIHLDDRFKRRAWVGLGPSWGLAGGGKEEFRGVEEGHRDGWLSVSTR